MFVIKIGTYPYREPQIVGGRLPYLQVSPGSHPRANVIKLFTAVSYEFF
jgi:hypothetical protein